MLRCIPIQKVLYTMYRASSSMTLHIDIHVYVTVGNHGSKAYTYICICWQLLSVNFKGPFLKAEVVEEIMG